MGFKERKQIKKWHWFLLLTIAVVFVFLQFYNHYHWPEAKIGLKGKTLNVLVAKTFYQQRKGLGGRDFLAEYDGMLFIYPQSGKQGIVMRDMRFPIDIVWLEKGMVVDIAPNVPIEPGVPEERLKRYYPRAEANVVLELPAGWAEKFHLHIGDRMVVAP